MILNGKQIKDISIKQDKLDITTESIVSINSVTNVDYTKTHSINKINEINYATSNLNMNASGATIGDKACELFVIEFPVRM